MTGTHWNRLLMMLRRLFCASKWMSYDATNTTTTHLHVFKEVYVCESYSMRKYLNLPMEKNVHIRCINTNDLVEMYSFWCLFIPRIPYYEQQQNLQILHILLCILPIFTSVFFIYLNLQSETNISTTRGFAISLNLKSILDFQLLSKLLKWWKSYQFLAFQNRTPEQYFSTNVSSFSLLSFESSLSVLTMRVEIKCPKWYSMRLAWSNVNVPESSSANHDMLTAVYITSKYFCAANFSWDHTSAVTQKSFSDKWLKISKMHSSSRFMK